MKTALLTTLFTVLALIFALMLVANGMQWPAVERPPHQGEALDLVALKAGHIVHSPEALSRLIREPQNAWSNLGFIFVGAYLMRLAATRRARLVGAATIMVGIGSFFYHASASRMLRHGDVAAMYGLFLAAIFLSLGSLSPRFATRCETHIEVVAAVVLVFAICATLGRNIVVLGVKPLALVVATVVATTILIIAQSVVAVRDGARVTIVTVAFTIGLFAAAVICQIGDRPGGWLCAPQSIVQAHALWHVLAAAALLLAVRTLDRAARFRAIETSQTKPAAVICGTTS